MEGVNDILVPIHSHHTVLSVSLTVQRDKRRVTPPNETVYSFSSTDFHQLYLSFREANWDRVLANSNVDGAIIFMTYFIPV